MIRLLGIVIGVFCTATVLTGTLTLAYLWSQGTLNREASQEILAVLKGIPRPSDYRQEQAQPAENMVSYAEIAKMRTEKILNLSVRENELAILKQSLDDQLNSVLNERRQLAQLKKSFQTELAQEREKIITEAVAQARGILLKMETESAVEKLLALEPVEAVNLIKGLPEKDAARILDQFRQRIAGKDPNIRLEKAEEIYKAIYRGDPLRDVVDQAQRALQPAGNTATDLR